MNDLYVTRSSMPAFEEYEEEIKDIWESCWLTNAGKHHNELQEKLKEYLQCPYVELFSSGHMALELAIQAFDLSGEVITTPYTFISTTQAIIRNGLTPIFCDINPDDYTMDVSKIESLITERTSAIIPVHVYGNICNVEEIERIAKKYNLIVIYDAAHAFGETYKGRSAACFGDAAVFSFHATKIFHTIEGGAVCIKNEKISKKLQRLRNFGIEDEETVSEVGANAKMSEFHAAMGVCNLRRLDAYIEGRKKVYEWYHKYLGDAEGLRLFQTQKDVVSNFAYFPLAVNTKKFGLGRDEICDKLKAKGIFARKYFYPLTNQFQCYKGAFANAEVEAAKKISRNIITLPMYSELTEHEIKYVCQQIKSMRREAEENLS